MTKEMFRLQKYKVQFDFCEIVVGNLTSQYALKNPISMPERIANTRIWLWEISNPIRETNKCARRTKNEQ